MKTIITFDVEDESSEKSIGIAEIAMATAKMVYPEAKGRYEVFTGRHAPFVSVDCCPAELAENDLYQMWATFHAFGTFYRLDETEGSIPFSIMEVEDFMFHWTRQARDYLLDYIESDDFKELFLSLCREETQRQMKETK